MKISLIPRVIAATAVAALLMAQSGTLRSEAIDTWRGYRVGLFVHWGTATGRALPQSHSHARKSALNPSGSVPAEVYDEFYKEFNPTKYDPDALLKLAHSAGMRYAIFVAKHHDGFSLYNSPVNPYNVMATPFGKDVAGMFAEACRRQGVALGWQISPKDWKHSSFSTNNHEKYNEYYLSVVRELATQYGPLAAMWFDGVEGASPDQWKDTPAKVADLLRRTQPRIMLSNHSGAQEDFVSFENMVGPFDRAQPWETTEAINPSGWVFNKPMPPFPFRSLLRNLVFTIARDGNYLLDVGPMQDGQLYPPDAQRLGEFANWMKNNAEGVHGTRGGPWRDGDWGGATCRGRSIFLFVSDRTGTELHLQPLAARIRSAKRLDGGPLEFRSDSKGVHLTKMTDRANAAKRPVFTAIRLEADRDAITIPVTDAQVNLAATARATPAKGVDALFDNLGETAWDPEGASLDSALEFDLGATRRIGGVSFSQKTQRLSWHQVFRYEIKTRETEAGAWQTAYKGHSCLGGVPVIELDGVKARYVRLEFTRPRASVPVQLAELRIFESLP